MPHKELLTGLGIILAAGGYIRYILTILQGQTRPHFFSYLLWGIAECTIFAIQLIGDAGIGAWITGFNAVACLSIAGLAFVKGDKRFTKIDWISFIASALALLLWAFTKNSLVAVIFLIASDGIAYSITFRKTYRKPYSETLISYFFSWCKSLIAIFALGNYMASNWLFLAYLLIINGSFIIMTLIRRQQIKS
jgi:hypothetical protein